MYNHLSDAQPIMRRRRHHAACHCPACQEKATAEELYIQPEFSAEEWEGEWEGEWVGEEEAGEEEGEWEEERSPRARRISKAGRRSPMRRATRRAQRRNRPRLRRRLIINQAIEGSEFVRWVQHRLNQLLGLHLRVNGIMGGATRNAIRDFQRSKGLTVNGIVGPDTRQALLPPKSNGAAAKGDAAVKDEPDAKDDTATEGEEEEYVSTLWNYLTGKASGTTPPSSGTSPYVPPVTPAPSSPNVQSLSNNIAQIAVQEWQRWGQGTVKECDAGIRSTLEDYWRTGVGSVPPQANYCSSVAWSAAFISWVMRKAGAGSAFRYSGRHTDYVGAAKQNLLTNNSNPFKAYRITEMSPRVGDLVCLERESSGVTYDNVDKGSYASHCDIVVEVQPGQIKTIGGNLSHSVGQTTVKTDANGRVSVPGYYAVVRVGA